MAHGNSREFSVNKRFQNRLLIRLVSLLAAAASPTVHTADAGGAEAVAAVIIPVADLDRSVAFFTDVLTFVALEQEHRSGEEFAALHGLPSSAAARAARLRLGDELVELIDFEPPGKPMPVDSRSNDLWFQHVAIIVSDIEVAHERLQQRGVTAASRGGPQRLPEWNQAAAGIRAFYFRDPDGHFLEILQFPAGKGAEKWHRPGTKGAARPLFLGIDHTAIVVRDTEASLRFYRDALGFRVVGGSTNYGPEQENLNNVAGARLRITTLRAATGPAIEFLEYLQPRDGRPYPSDAVATDVLHWQTTLVAQSPATLADELRRRGYAVVASGTGAAVLARDPDGHAIRIQRD